jgi:hypothetical protein
LVPTQEELAAAEKMAADSFIDVPDGHGGKKNLALLTRANTDVSHREKNVAINIERPLPRFLSRTDLMALREEPIAIVAGGPSVKKHLAEISKFKWIMAAGSSHDYLVSEGIVPNFAISTDSKEETGLYYQNPQKGCCYLIASTAPPSLFDALEGYDVQMWHFHEQVDPPHYKGEQSIAWGCMVGVVCIQMALWLGFQEQHYFGYDCCLEPNATHAYDVGEMERADIMGSASIATMGEGENKVEFLTTTALICQMTHFYGVFRGGDGNFLKGYVYGPGMLWENIRRSPPEIKHWLEAV